MSAAVEKLLQSLDARVQRAETLEAAARNGVGAPGLKLHWETLDALLPDGGLPSGVSEFSAPKALGGVSRIAVRAICAAQNQDEHAWCAWIDPEASLYAPGLAQSGVDLSRLLVVRPKREQLGRIALKVVRSGAFDVAILDMDPVGGAQALTRDRPPELLVRQLSLAAQESGTHVVLLSDLGLPRAAPWPVALRLEVQRLSPNQLSVRIAKERHGRASSPLRVGFESIASS
ncbi:MAG: ImuA family protein [Myxococcaceae bacterium]